MPRSLGGSRLEYLSLLAVLITAQGCDEPSCREPPSDPELREVAQMLPEGHRVRLTREEVVRACQKWVACAGNDVALDGRSVAAGVEPLGVCVLLIQLAAAAGEVVINSNEDARFIVDCISNATGDCDRMLGCSTRNPVYDGRCYPVGCSRGDPVITCSGSVATIETETGVIQRDCARSRRGCDPESVSGCDDALRFSCPSNQLENRVSPCALDGSSCEGDVRIRCDGGQAGVFDCAVFGGTCREVGPYRATCVYPGAPDPDCDTLLSREGGKDANGEFQCVAARKVYLDDLE